MRNILFLILGVMFYSCKNKTQLPTQDQIISKMSEMSNLGTVEYSLSKIIHVNDKQWYTIGPRKVLIECKAYVKAGIDFKELKVIEINDSLKSIKIEIPEAKILIVTIPPSDIKVVNTDIGFFRSKFTNEELNEIHKQAEIDINTKIQDLNILPDAKKNGKLFLQNFLKSLGFEHIIIVDIYSSFPPPVLNFE